MGSAFEITRERNRLGRTCGGRVRIGPVALRQFQVDLWTYSVLRKRVIVEIEPG